MTVDVAQLRLDVDELTRTGGLLDQLEQLVPDQVGDPTVGTRSRKHAHSHAPWHAEAAERYYDIHYGARDLEAKLAYVAFGSRRGRGPSRANTRHALNAVPDLAAAAGPPHDDHARKDVESWCRSIRQLRDIDQEEAWSTLPRQPGQPHPPCPYCGTYALRWSAALQVVRCVNTDCWDYTGRRPKFRPEPGAVTGLLAWAGRDGVELTTPQPPATGEETTG